MRAVLILTLILSGCASTPRTDPRWFSPKAICQEINDAGGKC